METPVTRRSLVKGSVVGGIAAVASRFLPPELGLTLAPAGARAQATNSQDCACYIFQGWGYHCQSWSDGCNAPYYECPSDEPNASCVKEFLVADGGPGCSYVCAL